MPGPIETPLFLASRQTDLVPPDWFKRAMDVPRREGFITSDGCPLHYFEWGDRSKPGLVMLHGFLAHSHCLVFIAPFLARDYHIVAFDMSGMGDSGSRDGYRISDRAREIEHVAAHFGMFDGGRKPIICAHSYGGAVGLEAMESSHKRYRGLIICDLMAMRPERLEAFFGERQPRSERNEKRPNKVYPDYAAAKERFVLSPPQPAGVPYLFDYMAWHSVKQVEGGWTWKFDPGVFNRDDAEREAFHQTGRRIAKAPGRIAIVHGEQSLLFDQDSADYVRECGGTHVPIFAVPEAGHHLMLDQPMAFVASLRAILAMWEAQDEGAQ